LGPADLGSAARQLSACWSRRLWPLESVATQ
jgi:hypothetical protein